MGRMWIALVAALALAGCSNDSPTAPGPATQPLVVLNSSAVLASGFDILVNTSGGRTDWLSTTADGMLAAYPSGQQFGFVAGVLAGATAPGSRAGRDVSAYRTLQIQLRGAVGGEGVEIGIKDNTDPDDGTETKRAVVLTSSWQTLSFPLSGFTTADLKRVYLVFELVFNGTTGRSVYFRDVRYVL